MQSYVLLAHEEKRHSDMTHLKVNYESTNEGDKITLSTFFSLSGTYNHASDEGVLQTDDSIGEEESDHSLHQSNKVMSYSITLCPVCLCMCICELSVWISAGYSW